MNEDSWASSIWSACVLAMILLVGCGTADQETERYVVQDSAGIRIVESVIPLWDDSSRWTVSDSPMVRVGVSDGSPQYLFSRVAGAVRVAEGTIVVGDGTSNEVRFFDESGQFLRSVGRTGQGPGEFEYLRGLKRCGGDSVFAFDISWQMTVFDLAGSLVREARLTEPGVESPPYELACSPNGTFVITGWGDMQPQMGFYATTAPVWILDSNGEMMAELGRFMSSERIGSAGGSRPHPFGRSSVVAAGVNEVYVGPSEELEILVYDLDGMLRSIIRGPQPDLEIRSTHITQYRAERLDAAPPERRQAVAQEVTDMPLPPAFPAYDRLEVDSEGNLWLRRFQKPGDPGPVWITFDSRGVLLGELAMPEGLEVTEIGSDYVLGVHHDEFEVERIQLHELRKSN